MNSLIARLAVPLVALLMGVLTPAASAQVSGACNGCTVVGSTAPVTESLGMASDSYIKLTVTRSNGTCMGGVIPGAGTICTESYCEADVVVEIRMMGSFADVRICHYPAPPAGEDPDIDRDDCITPMPRLDQNGDLDSSWEQSVLCGLPTDISVDVIDALPAVTQLVECTECLPPGGEG